MTDIRKAAHMYILKNGTLCSYLNPRSVLTYLPMGAVCLCIKFVLCCQTLLLPARTQNQAKRWILILITVLAIKSL